MTRAGDAGATAIGRLAVGDVMTRGPVTMEPEAPLAVALAAMRQHEIRHLPVVDADGRFVGIVTDRDLRQASFARFRALTAAHRDLTVQDVMTCAVVTIPPGATVARAATVMFERRIGSLPVVQDGRLVGILTERDLLKLLMRDSPELEAELAGFV
jgi:CBS-domain-containing membrane protein